MFLAGCSIYLSMIKRRTKHGQVLKERIMKLILGFIFGLVVVAIPSNFFIIVCISPNIDNHIKILIQKKSIVLW